MGGDEHGQPQLPLKTLGVRIHAIGVGKRSGTQLRPAQNPFTGALFWQETPISAEDRVDEAAIASIEETQAVPAALAYTGSKDPFYSDRMRIHFRRTSANVRFTLMEGGHGGNFAAGLDFLSRQAKGRPADFSLPANGRGGEEKLGK